VKKSKSNPRLLRCIFAALLLLSFPLISLSQTGATGALAGVVTDTTGAVLPDVRVEAKNVATAESRIVVTQGNGSYTMPLLPPGTYRLEFSSNGFKLAVKPLVQINVTETARLDVSLEPGEVQEQVTVRSDPALLQTESSTLGRVTGRSQVSNLPLATRNFTQIIGLSPGIAVDVTNATELGRGTGGYGLTTPGGIRAHGAFARDNNFQMNGLPVNDLHSAGVLSGGIAIPNPDAIQEFKVQTALFDAAFGRNAGANVNVITRSGSNAFHGGAFEFFRNDALDANDFFRNRAGQERGVLKQNQFGFVLGGPIKKDRLLFFGSYQGTRQINGVGPGGSSSVFSPAFTNDRSRASLGALFAGQRGVAQNQLGGAGPAIAADGSNINPQALALLNFRLSNGQYLIPTPQTVSPGQPFNRQGFSAFSESARFHEDQFMINLDFVHNSKSNFAGRFFYVNNEQTTPLPINNAVGGAIAPGFPQNSQAPARIFSLSHTYAISPTLLNEAQFGYSRMRPFYEQSYPYKWSDVGVNAPSNADPYPLIFVQGSMTLAGNGLGASFFQNYYTIQDTVTWVRGPHTLRFGGGITRNQLDHGNAHLFGGLLFLSWPDFLLGLPGGPTAAGGNGTPSSNIFSSIDLPLEGDRKWRFSETNAFIQDDFKLTRSLTLNLGLRYEHIGAFSDKLGRNAGIDLALLNPNPPVGGTVAGYVASNNFPGTVPAGVKQLDNGYGLLGKHENNWAPRIGFAWRPPGRLLDRTVVRGGYGIYYSRYVGQTILQSVLSPPFAVLRRTEGAGNAAATFANPFGPEVSLPQFVPYSPTTQLTPRFIAQDFRPPVTQQYSLNLQIDLGHNFMLETGYVGARGTHQITTRTYNQAALASVSHPIRGVTTNTVANIPLRVPYQGFASNGLTEVQSSAESWYNSLEASLTKRLSNGLQFLASYTFAQALSTAGVDTAASGVNSTPGIQNDSRLNYGRSDFNRKHRFVVSYVYDLPTPGKVTGFTKDLLSGWSVSGVTTYQSGLPLTLTGTNTNNIFGITSDRAQLAPGCTYRDLVTSGSIADRLNNYFNSSCILRTSTGAATWQVIGDDGGGTAFGNSGVGVLTGPGQRNWDISLMKRTPIRKLGESGNLELRAEFFNAFNTPQFANPSTNVSAANFGVISATSVNPRVVQLAVKVNF
jgi:hypothetical protein